MALAISWLTLSPLLLILDGRGMKTAMPLTSSLTSILIALIGWCFIGDDNHYFALEHIIEVRIMVKMI